MIQDKIDISNHVTSVCFFSGDTDMIVLCLANLKLFNDINVYVQIMYRRYENPLFDIHALEKQILQKYNTDTFEPVFVFWLLVGNDFIPQLLNLDQIDVSAILDSELKCDSFSGKCILAKSLLQKRKVDNEILFFFIKWCCWYFIDQYNNDNDGLYIVNDNPLDEISLKCFKKTFKTEREFEELISFIIENITFSLIPSFSKY